MITSTTRYLRTSYLTVLGCTLLLTCAQAADWPQYLGPNRNSTSPEKGLLRSWPPGEPEVLWTVPVGRGFGGPAVKDGKVYLLDRDDAVGDTLRCFDLATGRELWTFAYAAPGTAMFPGSRSVPTVDESHVYTCGHNGDLYCVDLKTHQPVWHRNVWTDFGGAPNTRTAGATGPGRERPDENIPPAARFPTWAITQNPLIHGDRLIVASQAPEAGVVAYDKLTGTVKWKTPSLGLISYASPAIVKVDGQDHVVMVTSSTNPFQRVNPVEEMGNVVGLDPVTGNVLWKYTNWHCHISVASAVDAGDNRVLVVGGYELGATMIQVEKQPDGSYQTRELFTTVEFGDQTKPPLLHNGYVYAQYGTNSRREGLVCLRLDGKIMWKTRRSPDFNKGSMILADGLILATDGERKLYLIEPDPSGFKPLASAEMFPEGAAGGGNDIASRVGGRTQNWAPMALSDGKLLLRDQNQLKCVKVCR